MSAANISSLAVSFVSYTGVANPKTPTIFAESLKTALAIYSVYRPRFIYKTVVVSGTSGLDEQGSYVECVFQLSDWTIGLQVVIGGIPYKYQPVSSDATTITVRVYGASEGLLSVVLAGETLHVDTVQTWADSEEGILAMLTASVWLVAHGVNDSGMSTAGVDNLIRVRAIDLSKELYSRAIALLDQPNKAVQ